MITRVMLEVSGLLWKQETVGSTPAALTRGAPTRASSRPVG